MIGFKQLVSCCDYPHTTVEGPDFSGDAKFHFHASGSIQYSLDATKFYAMGQANTLCDSYNVMLWDGTAGHLLNQSVTIDYASTALSSSNVGSYSAGIRQKYYSGTVTIPDKYISQDFNSQITIFSKVTTTGGSHYASPHCDQPFHSNALLTELYGTHDSSFLADVGFYWLATAQRELCGIRLKQISGTDSWMVEVRAGMVAVYTQDGTKSFTTSGTLKQVADNINASSISTWIQARCSGWNTSGETDGTVAAGKNEWHYLFTQNDPSTMLRDLPPTYLNVSCSDSYAPYGWYTSTRLPIYVRGDVLPPRGCLQIQIVDNAVLGFNTLSAQYPQLKTYTNDAAGALAFVTGFTNIIPRMAWGGDVDFNVFDGGVEVGVGTKFYDIWHRPGGILYTDITRVDPGVAVFDKTIAYGYTPLQLQIYDEKYSGQCTVCGTLVVPVDEYGNTVQVHDCDPPVGQDCPSPTCSPPNCAGDGCYYNACPVYCFDSPCYYPGSVKPWAAPSCAISSGCTSRYSYYAPGATVTTTPPTSGEYKASVSSWVYFS